MEFKEVKYPIDFFGSDSVRWLLSRPYGRDAIAIYFYCLAKALRSDPIGELRTGDLEDTPESLGFAVGIDFASSDRAVSGLLKAGFLEQEGELLKVKNIDEMQGVSRIMRKREKTRERTRKYRERMKGINHRDDDVTRYTGVTSESKTGRKDRENPVKNLLEISKNDKYLSKKGVLDYWNDHITGEIPQLRAMTDSRYKNYKRRIDEGMDLDEIFKKIDVSDFLRYGGAGSNWKMTFDWLVANDKNWVKVMEGQYTNKGVTEPDVPDEDIEEDEEYQRELERIHREFREDAEN